MNDIILGFLSNIPQSWLIYTVVVLTIVTIAATIQRFQIWYMAQETEQVIHNQKELTPEEFFIVRRRSMKSFKNASTRQSYAVMGVYVLHNKTKNRHYVGQGKNILDRVNQHLTGRGNGDVYVDYRNGDEWVIKLIDFADSRFETLNDLERHTIQVYDAFHRGYNKTRGNRAKVLQPHR